MQIRSVASQLQFAAHPIVEARPANHQAANPRPDRCRWRSRWEHPGLFRQRSGHRYKSLIIRITKPRRDRPFPAHSETASSSATPESPAAAHPHRISAREPPSVSICPLSLEKIELAPARKHRA